MPTPERRAAGEGSIRQRADGRFQATVTLGTIRGKQQRKYFYGKTRPEVVKQLQKFQADRARTSLEQRERITLDAWFEHWVQTVISRYPRTSTRISYAQAVHVHIAPKLGHHLLTKLQPHHVERWLTDLLGSGLAPTTVRRLQAMLKMGLEHAARQGYIARNVAALVPPVKMEKPEIRPLDRSTARALLEAAVTDRDAALYTLVLFSGLRQGEVLGLHWSDIDLEARTVHVRKQYQRGEFTPLKRGASQRILSLDPVLVDALRAHRARLKERQLVAGQRWTPNDLVFPTDRGTPQRAGNLHRAWKRLLKRAGLPDARFHDLRHTAATLALSEGATLFDVSRMLGHASIATTSDTYGHWTAEGREDVADRLARALRGA